MSDVVCIGIAVADALGRPIDTIPDKGRLQLFDRMELHTGGCAVNTGIAMAKLGADVAVICKAGTDGFGDFLENELKKQNVNTEGFVRDPRVSTSFTFVMISSDGERRFLHTLGANATFALKDIKMDLVRQAKIVHVAGTFLMPSLDGEPTARLLRQAKAAGAITTLDTAFNDRITNCLELVEPCFPHLDYFAPSIEEAERITGLSDYRQIARWLIDRGCRNVVLKLGREGSFGIIEGKEYYAPIYKVKTVDSSGAGDCFLAGFLRALQLGLEPKEALKLGNAVAAQCVQAVGCTAGVPSLDKVRQFQREYEREAARKS